MVLSLSLTAQGISPIVFINELDGKKVATYGDALRMFRLQIRTNKVSNSYLLKGYFDEIPLTKGMVSLMIARYLNLKKSFMYKIFDTERYAYRACLANKLFSELRSENDLMSGSELIELFTRVDEFNKGKNKEAAVKGEAVKDEAVKDEAVKEGTVKEGTVKGEIIIAENKNIEPNKDKKKARKKGRKKGKK